jgi:membrane-bound serine protease (ClpP class)
VPAEGFVRVERTAADRLVALLTATTVTTVLILAGLVALYLEITTPGFGLPGTVALACFAVVFGANVLLGTVDSLELILFLLGIILLLVEVFLIPGFGVVGISGLVLLALGLVLSMQDFVIPRLDWQWDLLRRNGLVVLGGIVGAAAVLVVLAQFVPRLSPFRRLALATTLDPAEGFAAPTGAPAGLVPGRRGTALTTLRPVGKADFDGTVTIVRTEGGFLAAGAAVEVVEVAAGGVVVREVEG